MTPAATDPPVEPSPTDVAPTLVVTARAVGGHRWIESRLFALTGAWSAGGDRPEARGFFSAQSAFHGWRAEQWDTRRPRSVPSPDGPPGNGWQAATDWAAALESDLERLGVWVSVFQPALLVGYRRHLGALAPAADAGLGRWLGLALDDATSGWLEGADLLTRLVVTAGDVRRLGEAETGARARLRG